MAGVRKALSTVRGVAARSPRLHMEEPMRAPFAAAVKFLREAAYGIDTMSAVMHGSRPSVPPYPPPIVFSPPGSGSAGSQRRTPGGR